MCAKVRVACGNDKRNHVGETLAQEDGEVDVHIVGGRVRRSGAGSAGRGAVYGGCLEVRGSAWNDKLVG
jgi:hypothetical protein